jgi:hypothetical protein
MRLPLSETKVPARTSINNILDDLEAVGFDEIAQVQQRGQKGIVAGYQGITFRWIVEVEKVVQALLDKTGPRTKDWIRHKDRRGIKKQEQVRAKAERIAWRVMADQVHATRIGLEYGVLEVGAAFGGFLSMTTKDGRVTTLGQFLAERAATGKLDSPKLLTEALLGEEKP